MRILAVEPYLGGSHRSFLEGLRRHSRHDWEIAGLPARKWKWRMRQGAVALRAAGEPGGSPDVIFASDFLDVAAWRGLSRSDLPVVLYFHENQITYPVRAESDRDYHFGWTNFASALAADEVWFNSAFHRESFLEALPRFLRRMPDGRFDSEIEEIRAKSRVVRPGIERREKRPAGGDADETRPLRILWNHRWEFDKAPERFFAVLDEVARRGRDFELVVLGESFREVPEAFEAARLRFRDRIAHWGYEPDPVEYARRLAGCDLVVSTAIHEFFGLAVLEAIAAGCFPLLPRRLSYPELIPVDQHGLFLYDSDRELAGRLDRYCADPRRVRRGPAVRDADRFFWDRRILEFDEGLDEVARKSK